MEKQPVHHILKGGEDSIGALEAIQRVYFNIGSCSEQCWLNHLTDLRQLDPEGRNYGQTPFDIGQCRRDCPNFRAIEDRLANIEDFLFSKENHATDLHVAREKALQAQNPSARYGYDDLVADLDKQFGKGAVARGRVVFAEKCASCHSSVPESEGGAFASRDFRALDPKTGLRRDWLGNDQATRVSEVGTYRCRALHSNHMTGHVWQEYGSETLRARKPDGNVKEEGDGGRGYYRNISLLSLWAHAPFLHNNAMGPEICGKPRNADNFFYRSPYVDRTTKELLPNGTEPACWPYDPSVEGRFKLYVASMTDLLNPGQRVPKITKLDVPVPLRLGLRRMRRGRQAEAGRRHHGGRAQGGEFRRPRQFPAQDVRARPGDVEAQGRRAGADARQDPWSRRVEEGPRRSAQCQPGAVEAARQAGRDAAQVPETDRVLQQLHRRHRERRAPVR